MTEPERAEMAKLIYALAEVLGKPLSQPQLLGYELALEDLPIAKIRTAVKAAMKTKTFMPAPSELLELAGVSRIGLQATRAWATVVQAIRAHGYTGGLDAQGDNGLTHAVVRAMGGWAMLCRSTSEELHSFKAKRFGELYEAMSTATLADSERQPLIGEYGEVRALAIGGLPVARALPAGGEKGLVTT